MPLPPEEVIATCRAQYKRIVLRVALDKYVGGDIMSRMQGQRRVVGGVQVFIKRIQRPVIVTNIQHTIVEGELAGERIEIRATWYRVGHGLYSLAAELKRPNAILCIHKEGRFG